MEIPEAAIEAAARELDTAADLSHLPPLILRNGARQILEAALPALREQWGKEIEAEPRRKLEWALGWIEHCGEVPLENEEPEDFGKFQAAQFLLKESRRNHAQS